ncbi:CBS domain-containing protein [Chitinophaga terrae (ex Kim and Jung 2007)]|uniref:CBS domain-containing protein n=1 Tax=Chitinophaga terrae (ex Kim and Jung 2007) TaxID=408074 RepID=A0A1H3XZH2_9BACT|nr:nucleotidyltransferase family protein [Chitinophaga terrae (ex Kim and Jung 2007)]GEP89450.1 hypothetical protein CTE07_10950 [Chitinophaga terrae (ex Kim and Jung 2007)]SEA03948.1 CBS domain-containing protein [Chitinophaga terrae (ex Kim and Jung 2007)]
MDFRKHLIPENENIKEALQRLNQLAIDAILFVVDKNDKLIGSLTDGDIRRGLIKGYSFETSILEYIQPNPAYIYRNKTALEELESFGKRNLKIIPILDDEHRVVDIFNFRLKKALLPLDTVLMAGGKGERLMPLTSNCPKPMLKVGAKPIIEHNIDRLTTYGINKMFISIRYLGNQIKEYFGSGENKNVDIKYIEEDQPLGTFGAMSLIDSIEKDHILLMNSDLLTNIDFADFYKSFLRSEADLMIASIPYQVKVPYAVLQINNGEVISFDEKPTYDFYSNGGIYIFKRSLLSYLKKGEYFDATDFMDLLIKEKKKVSHYPIVGYWLDIGNPQDFERAQLDILHLQM